MKKITFGKINLNAPKTSDDSGPSTQGECEELKLNS